MLQCQECRKDHKPWRECPGGLEWYEPSDIRFCPNQMVWLMEQLHILEYGQWPSDPSGDAGRHTTSFHGAYFEGPLGYHAEVSWRLGQCGKKDSTLAYQHWVECTDELTLSDLTGLNIYKLRQRLRRVLAYISGYNRKNRTYNEFVQHRKVTKRRNQADCVTENHLT